MGRFVPGGNQERSVFFRELVAQDSRLAGGRLAIILSYHFHGTVCPGGDRG